MRSQVAALFFAAAFPALLPAQKVEWWQKTFEEALTAANDSKAGMVLLYCWRDGDAYCSSMFSGTLSDDATQAALGEFVCMGAKDEGTTRPLHDKFAVKKVPTILFVYPNGQVVDVLTGYLPVKEFLDEVARVRAGKDTIPGLQEAIEAKPDDLDAQLQLHYKLRRSGDFMGAKARLDAIVQKDPTGKSEAAAEAMLLRVTEEVFVNGVEPKDWDTKPLRSFVAKVKHKRVSFLAYDRLAAAEWQKGDLKAAVAAAEKAWKNIPPEHVLEWGQNVASKVYKNHEALDKINKTICKRAIEVSEKALEAVEKRHKAEPDKVWLANALFLHASVLIVANQRKEAFAAMDRAIELDPKNEGLTAAKKHWVDGGK